MDLIPVLPNAAVEDPTNMNITVPAELEKAVMELINDMHLMFPVSKEWHETNFGTLVELMYVVDANHSEVQHFLESLNIPFELVLLNERAEQGIYFKGLQDGEWKRYIYHDSNSTTFSASTILLYKKEQQLEAFYDNLERLVEYCSPKQFTAEDFETAQRAALRYLVRGALL